LISNKIESTHDLKWSDTTYYYTISTRFIDSFVYSHGQIHACTCTDRSRRGSKDMDHISNLQHAWRTVVLYNMEMCSHPAQFSMQASFRILSDPVYIYILVDLA